MADATPVTIPHTIGYRWLPEQWAEGLPLGNGELGVMVWSDGSRLRLSLDSAGDWDVRESPESPDYSQMTYAALRRCVAEGDFGAIDTAVARLEDQAAPHPTKVTLGRLDLSTEFDAASRLKLDLQDASVRGLLRRGKATHALHAFVCRERDLLCLRIDPWPEDAHLELLPFYETSPELAELGHPPVATRREGELTVAVQQILPDAFLALCWNARGPEIFVTYASRSDAEAAAALAAHPHEQRASFVELFDEHRESWRRFWSASAVALPERDLEFLWYFGVCLLASCTRRGSNPPGLQGLWPMDGRTPPWRGDYHADMNVQETFWSADPTNHLELLDAWLDFQHQILPAAEELTREIFGCDGAFWFCLFFPGYNPLVGRGWRPVAFAWSHTGRPAHLAWLRWRYSMDRRCRGSAAVGRVQRPGELRHDDLPLMPDRPRWQCRKGQKPPHEGT